MSSGVSYDLVQNMSGPSADRLRANNMDVECLRPWIGKDGKSYVTVNEGGKKRIVTANAPATLTKEAWIQYDRVIQDVVRDELQVVADIRAAGLEYRLPNGLANTVLQYNSKGDISPATLSMDPKRRSESDRPEYDLVNMPLPIIHKDIDIEWRELMASQVGVNPMPLDTTAIADATVKCMELLERVALGVNPPFTHAGGSVYGFLTFPERSENTNLTVPTTSNLYTTVFGELMGLRQSLINDKHMGPYFMYFNKQWATLLDSDFSTLKGSNTLRQRLLAVPDITKVAIANWLPTTNYYVVMFEAKSRTVRAVIGAEPYTVQWESDGGFARHLKVLMLLLVQIRPDPAGGSGVATGYSATP